MDIGERNLDPFIGWDIGACNTGHVVASSRTR
jgi:hypothetical protein